MDYAYRMSPRQVLPVDALSEPMDLKRKLFQTNAERLFRLNQAAPSYQDWKLCAIAAP